MSITVVVVVVVVGAGGGVVGVDPPEFAHDCVAAVVLADADSWSPRATATTLTVYVVPHVRPVRV